MIERKKLLTFMRMIIILIMLLPYLSPPEPIRSNTILFLNNLEPLLKYLIDNDYLIISRFRFIKYTSQYFFKNKFHFNLVTKVK